MRYLDIYENFKNESEIIEVISDCMVDIEEFLTRYQDCRETPVKHHLCFYEYEVPKKYLNNIKDVQEKLKDINIGFQLSCSIGNDNISSMMQKKQYFDTIEEAELFYGCNSYYIGFLFHPYSRY